MEFERKYCENPIQEIKKLTGRPTGINLEPVDEKALVLDEKVEISKGRKALCQSVIAAEKLKVNFIISKLKCL